MKKVLLTAIGIGAFTVAAGVAKASMMDVSINNIDTAGIEAVVLWYDVDSDFTLLSPNLSAPTLGDAIPESSGSGWGMNTYKKGTDNILRIDYIDNDYVIDNTTNPLKSGKIFSFNYSGSIKSLNTVQFLDIDINNLYDPGPVKLVAFAANQTVFEENPVPVPGALWLLGSGLAGFLAMRRKRD